MFERYLAEALTAHFSHIISNFDSDKVKISVWNGEVVLRDLILKQDALHQLSAGSARRSHMKQSDSSPELGKTKETECDTIPFKISHGHIGTFELHIPWQIFRRSQKKSTGGIEGNEESRGSGSAASCSLVLSDVDILISPGIPHRKTEGGDNTSEGKAATDPDREKGSGSNEQRIEKERLVQNILDGALFRKNIKHVADLYASTGNGENGKSHDGRSRNSTRDDGGIENKDKSYVKNLVENILSSLTITVRNIHLRYEDPGDCLGFETNHQLAGKKRVQHRPPFAVGVTLEEFKLGGTEYGPKSDNELYQISAVRLDSESRRNGSTIPGSTDKREIHEGLYSIKHKLAAAKNLSIYWDSDISLQDLIYVRAPRLQRREMKRERQIMHWRATTGGDDSLSSDDEFEDCASDITGGIPNAPLGRSSSFQEPFTEHSDLDQDDQNDLGLQSRHDMYSMLLCDALKSKDQQRTYIIQPISPSLHCSIVKSLGITGSEGDEVAPPSRAVLTLPASKFNITKDTLEDIAYLRRSFAYWNEMRQNFLTRQIYESLAKARPKVSPKEDPQAWWHYAFAAVKILSRIQKENNKSSSSSWKVKRRKGWLGLSASIQLRKQYVALYQSLLDTESSQESEKEELNSRICSIEDTLEPDEIAAFRLTVVGTILQSKQRIKRNADSDTYSSRTKHSRWDGWLWREKGEDTGNVVEDPAPKGHEQDVLCQGGDLLTWKYREIVYSEMMAAMEGESDLSHDALFSRQSDRQLASASLMLFKGDATTGSKLEMAVICQEIILQVDDIVSEQKPRLTVEKRQETRSLRRRRPILQLRCASVQKICFRHQSDWDITSTFASLELLDLMENTFVSADCPRLITRKRSWIGKNSSGCVDISEQSVRIGDKMHFHGGTIYVKKSLLELDASREHVHQAQSIITSINVKLSPMEILYSPESVQAISKVFSTTKTSELSVDYQRFKLMVSNWRAQQRRRLIEVLSQREKQVEINVDISAPVFLMHDKTSNGTLVLDLGRLSFRNGNKTSMSKGFDDIWNLSLQNIQVLCMPSPDGVPPSTYKLVHYKNTCHLVEPFSLDFILHTKFGNGNDPSVDEFTSRILIDATLPRLVFNMNSSSVRLVNRISEYRNARKVIPRAQDAMLDNDKIICHTLSSSSMQTSAATEPAKKSFVDVNFSAPLIVLRLINDVDGRDSMEGRDQKQTHIAALVVQGIGGNISRTIGDTGDGTTFTARLNSLYAKDLYQRAGRSFSLLLSSKESEMGEIPVGLSSSDLYTEESGSCEGAGSDLVRVHYEDNGNNDPHRREKELSIEFHELYVEWNPETIAAIQKALRLSREENNFFVELKKNPTLLSPVNPINEGALGPWHLDRTYSLDESVAFFDAVEEQPTETFSVEEDLFLSEPSSDEESSVRFLLGKEILSHETLSKAMHAIAVNDLGLDNSGSEKSNAEDVTNILQPLPILSVSFHLSKLRVCFNKESRLRRLFTAEMNETLVQFKSKPFGGRKIEIRVGNLTLTDPSHVDGSTLYKEILGLKTDSNENCSESMLQISHETFPRDDDSALYECQGDDDSDTGNLRIDRKNRKITGCDSLLTMHFSPMRFVYLQQLWLEMVDYFFEGIVGFEVWGKTRPCVGDAIDEAQQNIKEQIFGHKIGPEVGLLPWADANGVKFLRISITLEAPIIILPVEYRSPQHLRISVDQIKVKNMFHGEKETISRSDGTLAPYVQWYNNYHIDFLGLHLSSWCGTQLNIADDPKIVDARKGERTSIPMKIRVTWPIGPTAFTIVPKWNFHCSIDKIRLLFRKNDFALFQHIIWNNIGEESRHLDEWNALQNLPPDQLVAYKEKIMVHFGYDKKDGPPTTFHFKIDMSSIIIHFCLDESNHVADLEGLSLHWSLRKVKDRISRQFLTFQSIHLTQTSGKREWARCKTLLFPLKDASSGEERMTPQLVYRSTSKLNGDNVKFLTVSNACIYLIYPAWMFVRSFFRNLPDPDVMDSAEVLSSVQISDRWYRVQKSLFQGDYQNRDIEVSEQRLERIKSSNSFKAKASFQFRLLLESPRIVLVDNSALDCSVSVQKGRAVTLGLGHLDFLHRSNPMNEITKKTVFLHDLELFTGSTDEVTCKINQPEGNSLLYPLSIGIGSSIQYEGDNIIASNKWISSDVISARAAYSDITLATDVFLKTFSDYRQVQTDDNKPATQSSPSTSPASVQQVDVIVKESLSFACGGFDLLVVDDSGRHFLSAQELVQVSISGILYKRSNTDEVEMMSTMRLQLNSVELIDCLQPKHSPFRVVAIGKHFQANDKGISGDMALDQKARWLSMNNTVFKDFMSWQNHSCIENSYWGYSPSPSMRKRFETTFRSKMRPPFDRSNLIDLDHKKYSDGRDEYSCKVRSIVLQWNPSMAIALQRFLGRLRKQAKEKYLVERMGDQSDVQAAKIVNTNDDDKKRNQKMQIEFQSLTLCLNKEHQHRRLLQITMTKSFVCFQRDQYSRLNVYGHIGDFSAWDSDGSREGQVSICRENRLVIGVLHDPANDEHSDSSHSSVGHHCPSPSKGNFHRLLSFNFYSQPKEKLDFLADELIDLELPGWVRAQVGEDASVETIDDCLSLSIATVRFNHIKDRTGELMDYLSNGLPGKGMGATSRAAKGFITKRIKTRSFTNLSINSPQLLLPRNRGVEDGIIVCLGDVRLKSWFDEATLEDSAAIDCDDLTLTQIPMYRNVPITPHVKKETNQKYWWRVLSLSILGFGWRANKEKEDLMSTSLAIENPVNIYLQARKPPVHSNKVLPMIVRCRMTSLELVLRYSEYILLNAVLKENVMKKVDKSLWDNIEEVNFIDDSVEEHKIGVQYSKNARFVRYGEQSKRHLDEGAINTVDTESASSVSATSMDIKLSLDGMALTLCRDDLDVGMPNDLVYDIVSLDINDVIFSMTANTDESRSATIEFNNVSLLDVGDTGRIAREQFQIRQGKKQSEASNKATARRPSVFNVIAEGYDTPDSSGGLRAKAQREPLLIIAVDTKSSASFGLESLMDFDCDNAQVTSVRVTLNKMNINPLIKPLGEITDFISCGWSAGEDKETQESEKDAEDQQSEKLSVTPSDFSPATLHNKNSLADHDHIIRAYHLTVVTNYPRIFLVPDETDPSTRALVLRGLTVVNATLVKEMGAEKVDRSRLLSIEGRLHSLESYINPDPRSMLERRSLWQNPINEIDLKDSDLEKQNGIYHDSLGVALIEPVTAAFNFRQIKRKNFPTIREAFLSMEPVSTTFSFEDIRLIEVVFKRWKAERELKHSRKNRESSISSTESIEPEPYPKKSLQDNETLLTPSRPKGINSSFDEEEDILRSDSLDAQTNSSICGSCISTDSLLACLPGSPVALYSQGTKATTSPICLIGDSKPTGDEYSVLFRKQKLGLVLRRSGVTVTVDKVLDAEHSSNIRPGDQVLSIGARAIAGMPFQSVLAYLKKAKRPLLIYFRPKNIDKPRLKSIEEGQIQRNLDLKGDELPFEKEKLSLSLSTETETGGEFDSDVEPSSSQIHYTTKVSFKRGVDHGLMIEKCQCGDLAVIVRVSESTYRTSSRGNNWKGYMPQPGTAIVAINKEPAISFGYNGTVQMLQSYVNDEVDEEDTYSLTFLDASADDWGAVDKLDIVVAEIKLTLIDDINGRDMPLLRWSLAAIALRLERGLGLDCDSIKVSPPSILSASKKDLCDGKECIVASDSTEVITKIYGNAEIQLDYYNARIAVWEPFLEPYYLSVEGEYQKGNESLRVARPGSLSLSLSDYQALADSSAVKQSFVCLNLTDAAADLLMTAFHEWKIWRKSLKYDLDKSNTEITDFQGSIHQSPKCQKFSSSHPPLPLPDLQETYINIPSSSSSIGEAPLVENILHNSRTNRGAVQNAAQAALIFARRRGAEFEKYGGSKPFVFRNKTGMQVSFVSELQSNFRVSDREPRKIKGLEFNLDSYKFSSVTSVEDGGEARFSLDNGELEPNRGSNKVRSYDEEFPLLSVSFHSPVDHVQVEVLRHMSVVKIGETMKRLVVQKVFPNDEKKVASTLVVWSVALEHNRRIITLSSAVRVASQDCGIPIEVGLRYPDNNIETDEDIKYIGRSSSTNNCFLPLWIELTLSRAEIYIRPFSSLGCYRWSKQNILHLTKSSRLDLDNTQCWTWEMVDFKSSVQCDQTAEADSRILPAWLSYRCNYYSAKLFNDTSRAIQSSERDEEDCIKQVDICSNVSIRNALPTGLEWEVMGGTIKDNVPPFPILDGSSLRERQGYASRISGEHDQLSFELKSGHGTDVLSCDMSVQLNVRIRCDNESEWSEWLPINSLEDNQFNADIQGDKNLGITDTHFESRSTHVQSHSKAGTPLTLGLKINPRVAMVRLGDRLSKIIVGYEILTYSEVWIKNLTSLPILFGVPSNQVTAPPLDGGFSSRVAAEAALSELSSLLEFGEKGHNLAKTDNEGKDILVLPQQQCDIAVEEVFEYVELENGNFLKKWWAGEHHISKMPDLASLDSLGGTLWRWKDESWSIDTSGGSKADHGGWESCISLVGGKTRNFTASRNFNPSHRFRRRRWFRRKVKSKSQSDEDSKDLNFGISSFHHSIFDASSRVKEKNDPNTNKKFAKDNGKGFLDVLPESDEDESLKVCFKVDDSAWSTPAMIPYSGSAHGVLRIPASRWPAMSNSLTKSRRTFESKLTKNSVSAPLEGIAKVTFKDGCLSHQCFDISYQVSSIGGQWGENSRLLMLFPRYFIRNDSEEFSMDVKQVGASDSAAMRLNPGSSRPFYWADIRLPELICIRPVSKNEGNVENLQSWSGGFDITCLGLIPLRIRENVEVARNPKLVNVVRALVELRSGTGGTGTTVSLKDERNNGEDSLYRIDNQTPFPLWIAQDGILVNPHQGERKSEALASRNVILPMSQVSYGLDVPFRQGKYSGRKPVSFEELMRLRVGLAPLTSRDGIESTKVVGLSRVEANIRLKPAKLRSFFDDDTIADLMCLNVQGVVSADGPTRVLKFTLIQRELTASSVIKNSVRMHTGGVTDTKQHSSRLHTMLKIAAEKSLGLLRSNGLPKYDPRISPDSMNLSNISSEITAKKVKDCNYSFRASFSGFVFSLVDKVPSEIAVISLRKVDAMAEWNASNSKESTGAVSIGWMQVDNHCPNAPFPVALCQSLNKDDIDDDGNEIDRPFLTVGVVRAPQHKSNTTCLDGITIAPSDISLATDLALLVRIQYYLLSIFSYLEHSKVKNESDMGSGKEIWSFPDFERLFTMRTSSTGRNNSSKSMYFGGLTFMPFTLKLSVAPAVALTSAQAALEGPEAGAIHAAVRKGDLLIGSQADGVLGVKIGSKNRTALAVIRGIFKSILVDSLLRCNDVSMNFSGLALRNHLSTIPQLKTYIFHHYLSLLKSNMPALLGSLAAFGNPVGLIRGFGDGMTDFVSEPFKGFRRSVQELDPTYVMDGVARGTGSLARHTVGGIVDSASLLTETFSKNMAVLTLDRKYAQRRDRFKAMPGTNATFVGGVESGMGKFLRGVAEGVIGVVRAPMRGAEKRGVEGFAKGVGKGLLGLVVKPVIGISDAATDVMVGVKGSLEGAGGNNSQRSRSGVNNQSQIRPRRAFYGRDRRLRPYAFVDAISAAIMMRTRLAGENYLSHVDMGGRVAILSVRRFLLLGDDGETQLLIKLKNIKRVDLRHVDNNEMEWGVFIFLKTPRKNGNQVEVITSEDREIAQELESKIKQGIALSGTD